MSKEKFVDFATTDEYGMVCCYMMIADMSESVKQCFVTREIANDYPELDDDRVWVTGSRRVWIRWHDDEDCTTTSGVTLCVKPWAPEWFVRMWLKFMYLATKKQYGY